MGDIFNLIIVQPVFNLLMFIYSVIPWGDFGITLIIFTLIVRMLMYPLIKKQMQQTVAMRKMQPEIAKIKKNAKGNRQLEALQTMELYKKHNISPFRSIGILLLQLPIFFGLFRAIQILTIHRDQIANYAYGFTEKLAPVQNLINNPDNINHNMLGFISFSDTAFSSGINISLIILAVLSGLTQYYMTKQTMPSDQSNKSLKDLLKSASDGKSPSPTETNAVMMRGMMRFMPIMMVLIMLNLPGGLAFYYTCSNLIALVQQQVILKHIREKDAADESKKPASATTAKKKAENRAKNAKEANITRIVAKDGKGKKK